MAEMPNNDVDRRPLVYRQRLWTRITHWIWAIALFFLLLSGLQIFNAHPTLYLGKQSGFGFDNEVLALGADTAADGQPAGYTRDLRPSLRHDRRARAVGAGRERGGARLSGLGDDPVLSGPGDRAASCISSSPGCSS